MSSPRSESGKPAADASNRRRRALTYDDLPKEIKGAIQDYLRHTNASLREAVEKYFEDKAATEREWGKIGTWDVGRVTDMSNLFSALRGNFFGEYWRGDIKQRREDFNEDIGAWDTSSVTTMKQMFQCCVAYEGRGIGAWDTASVTDMSYMFAARKDNRFNEDIGAWDTSSVTDMTYMFWGCKHFNSDIQWDTSRVTRMHATFGASRFNMDISAWDTASVKDMGYLFYMNPVFNQDLSRWDVSNVSRWSEAFTRAEAFEVQNRPIFTGPPPGG